MMKYVYMAYIPILTITYLLFVQRAIYWGQMWLKGAKKLKATSRYSDKYYFIYRLKCDAIIQTICWIVLSLVVMYAYMDCILNLKARW